MALEALYKTIFNESTEVSVSLSEELVISL